VNVWQQMHMYEMRVKLSNLSLAQNVFRTI
jgi:hypothetical protein